MAKVVAIAAMDSQGGIGRDGRLPWRCPADMEHFRKLTLGHILVVGRVTYENLPQLDGRTVVVLSSRYTDRQRLLRNCVGFNNFKAVMDHFRTDRGLLFVGGGAEVYRSTMAYWTRLHLTVINGSYECDTHMPDFALKSFKDPRVTFAVGCQFKLYRFS